jgi:hypothetical protein
VSAGGSHRRLQAACAVLVLEADSVEAAQEALSQLPLLVNEVMALELIELRPFTALQMLFREGVAR